MDDNYPKCKQGSETMNKNNDGLCNIIEFWFLVMEDNLSNDRL